jgi:hypothetical protein
MVHVETALEHLHAFGFVKYEQRPAVRLWNITPAGEDALYDWDPWRFRVDRLVPAARAKLEEPDWRRGVADSDAVVAVGQFLGQVRPGFTYRRDAFEVEGDARRGWVVGRVFDHPRKRLEPAVCRSHGLKGFAP